MGRAGGGFEVFAHALEGYVCLKATKLTDAINERAMELVWDNLSRAWRRPRDFVAREAVMLGANLAGMTIASTGVGACHAVAHSIGGKFNVSHGETNALLLPHVVDYNLGAARKKYAVVAELVGGKHANDLPRLIGRATKKTGLRAHLSELGVAQTDLAAIARDSFRGSMAVNPRKATRAGIVRMLKGAL